jgi:hypothetical protein
MLEKLKRDKHTSVLQILLNYRLKKFYNIGPRLEAALSEKMVRYLFICKYDMTKNKFEQYLINLTFKYQSF